MLGDLACLIPIIMEFLWSRISDQVKEDGTGSATSANKEAAPWVEGASPAPWLCVTGITARLLLPGGSALGKEIKGYYRCSLPFSWRKPWRRTVPRNLAAMLSLPELFLWYASALCFDDPRS